MPTDLLLVLCTVPDLETADKLAADLVNSSLAACVNISPPLTSVYRWQGELTKDQERLLLIKTTASRYKTLESHIRERHPYELPEIIAVTVDQGLSAYLDWVDACTNE